MKLFLTIFVTASAMLPELWCGNLGIQLGLPVYSSVYFYAAYGPLYGIGAAGISGLLLDVIYNRYWLLTAPGWILISCIGFQAAQRWQRRKPAAPLFSGILCGAGISLWNDLIALLAGGEIPGPDIFSMLIFQSFSGGIFMLLITLLFDAVNFRCNLPQFSGSASGNRFTRGRI